jgi:hypothetical protein
MTPTATRSLLAALGLAVVAAIPASSTAQQRPRECFIVRNVNGFNAPDDRTLYIGVGASDIWRLDLARRCNGLSFQHRGIRLETTPPNTISVCQPIQVTVTFREGRNRRRCQVRGMTRLTPAERAALPGRNRPRF